MAITVTGRKMSVSEALKDYAEEKVGNSLKIMDINPVDAEVVLTVNKNPSVAAPCRCEITVRLKGHVVHVEEWEGDMYAAIDVASAKIMRQLRKYKTRVLARRDHSEGTGEAAAAVAKSQGGDLDLDALMAELSQDDEVVRVKEIEFMPMTEDEALVQIDLLGHDFFAYIDRDTNVFCVLYRRSGGGYGLLKQSN